MRSGQYPAPWGGRFIYTSTEDNSIVMGIAYGTLIESAIGTKQIDVIYGNAFGNDLQGGGSGDILVGGGGNDNYIYLENTESRYESPDTIRAFGVSGGNIDRIDLQRAGFDTYVGQRSLVAGNGLRELSFDNTTGTLVGDIDDDGLADFAVAVPGRRASHFQEGVNLLLADPPARQANDHSVSARISSDGRFVAFNSNATNFVPDDTNGFGDVFVYNRASGTTELASVDNAGNQASSQSGSPSAINANGRFISFNSDATNLVAGDTNGTSDVFVHDRTADITERVSVGSAGSQGNGLSSDPAISGNGRFVAFASNSNNLMLNDTNLRGDIFVHDRTTDITERVSVTSAGAQGNAQSAAPTISADGRFVAFLSEASNLVSNDTNGAQDLFVHDRTTDTTARVSVGNTGGQGNGGSFSHVISGDGRFVAFASSSSNLVSNDTNDALDVFIRDRVSGTTARVSVGNTGNQGNGDSSVEAISPDGRFVAFSSTASNFVPGDTNGANDIFIRDRSSGTTQRVSLSDAGTQGNGDSGGATISADGRFVAFSSIANNLVSGDTNGFVDIFIRDRSGSGNTTIASNASLPTDANDFLL